MACKVKIKKNIAREVENLSSRGLGKSLKFAKVVEKEVNDIFGYDVVKFNMQADYLDRIITIPDDLVDVYYNAQTKKEEEEARDVQRKDAKRAEVEYTDDYLFYQIKPDSKDSYKNTLLKFLKDNGFEVNYDELKNYDDFFQFERGIDLISKQVFLPNTDVLPEKEVIILAINMLKKTDNFFDLKKNIEKWDKYEELKNKHIADIKKTGSIHYRDINRTAELYVIYDFVSDYLNKETEDSLFKKIKDIIFKLLHDLKLLKHSFYKAEEAAKNIAKDIIEDKISSQFEIPENYELTVKAHWDESFNELRTIARNLGMVETGSSVLRTYGDIYRGKDKIENDLDVILPYEDFLKLVDMDDKTFQGMIKNMSEEEYLEFVQKEIKNILGNKFKLDNVFVGPEHKGNRSATLTYYYGDKKIDIFVRTSFIFKNEFLDYQRIIQDNLSNKLQMARLKDIVDYRFFVPKKEVELTKRSPAVQVFKRLEEIDLVSKEDNEFVESGIIKEKKRKVLEFLSRVKGLKEFESDLYFNSKEEVLVKKNEELLKKIEKKTKIGSRYLKERIHLMIDLLPSKYSKGVRLRDVYSWLSPQALREGIISDLNLSDVEVDKRLEDHLVKWAEKYNIKIKGIQDFADSQNISLLGAADVINKIIYLAKTEDRNVTTLPEEVATMMLFMIGKGYKDGPKLVRDGLRQIKNYPKYSEIYQEYSKLDRYKHIEDGKLVPWDEKINYEILSKAIAERVVIKYKARQGTENELFKIINNIIDWFVNLFKDQQYLNLDVIVNELAEDLLREESKLIQTKPEKYSLATYNKTLENNPLLVEVLEKTKHLKGIPTGSLSYRNQMDTYRKEDEAIHDLDLILENENFDSIEHAIAEYKKALPGMFIPQFIDPINTKVEKEKIWETENAQNATGYYGGELLGKLVSHGGTLEVVTSANGKEVPHQVRDTKTDKIYIETGRNKNGEVYHKGILLDLFYYKTPKKFIVDNRGLAHYLYSYNEKLKYARPKDALDLVLANNFRNVEPITDLENEFIFYQTEQKKVKRETEKKVDELRNSVVEDSEIDLPQKHYEKLLYFQKAFPHVKSFVDYNMPQRAVVLGKNTNEYKNLVAEGTIYDGQIVMKFNPNKIQNDTVIHEFGHLFIDLLISNGRESEIKEAIDRLRNTELWNNTANKYPELEDTEDLNKYTLGKEVLATAMGLDGTELYDNDNVLIRIINNIIDLINDLLGITTARLLARELLDSSNNIIDLGAPFSTYEQKDLTTQSEIVNFIEDTDSKLRLDKEEINYLFTDKDGVVQTLQRMTNYLKDLFPDLFSFDKEFEAINQAMRRERIFGKFSDLSQEEQIYIRSKARDIQDKWDSWRDSGTSIHKLFENLVNYTGNVTNSLISDWMKDEENYPGMSSFSDNTSSLNEMRELVNTIKNYKEKGAKILTERKFYGVLNGQIISGTLDLIVVKKDGKVLTFDFKTFGGTIDRYNTFAFPKHVAQLEAYNQLLKNQGITVEDSFVIPVQRTLKDGEIVGLRVEKFKNIKTLNVPPIVNRGGGISKVGYTYRSIKNTLSGENLSSGITLDKVKDHIMTNLKQINKNLQFIFENASSRGDIVTEMSVQTQIDKNEELINELAVNETSSAVISFLDLTTRRLKNWNKKIENIYKKNILDTKTKNDVYRDLIQTKNQMQVYLDMIQEIQALDESNFEKDSYKKIQESLQAAFFDYHHTFNMINNLIMKEGASIIASHGGISELYFRRKYTDEFSQKNKIETASGEVDIMKVIAKAPLTIIQQLIRIVGQPIVKLVTLGKGSLDFDIYNYIPGLKDDSTKFYYDGKEVSADKYKSELNKYVQKQMVINKPEIENIGKQVALEYLINGSAPSITATWSLINKVTDPRGQKEYRTRTIINMADAIKMANNEKVIDYSKRMQALVSIMDLGKFSDARIFQDFIDNNGFMVTKYKSDFYLEYKSLPIEDRKDWLKENTKEVVFSDYGNEYVRFIPIDKYLDPRYEKVKDNELYKLFIEIQEEIHRVSNGAPSPLKKTFMSTKAIKLHEDAFFYELPSIRRTFIDKVEDEGFEKSDIISFAKNLFKFRPDDMMIDDQRERKREEKRKILSEERLRKAKSPEERRVLLDTIKMQDHRLSKFRFKNKKHYRGEIGSNRKEHLANLSRNIAKSLLLDYADALDFQMTRSLESTVDILDETLEIRLYEGEEVGTIVKNVTGRLMKKDWSETEVPEAFRNAVSQHVYREPVGEDAPHPALFKATEKFRKYSRSVAMGINYISQSMQWMIGAQDIKMEAISGGLYNEENYNNAVTWYNDDKEIIKDITRNHSRSITNLLREKFRITDIELDFTNDRVLWKMAGHATNVLSWGEDYANHVAYSTLMYMVLDTYKAVNENGDFINVDGGVTDKPVSIYYFIEKVIDVKRGGKVQTILLKDKKDSDKVVKNTYIRFNDKVKGTNRANFNKVNIENATGEIIETDHFSDKVHKEIRHNQRELFGNYELYNKSIAGKKWYGPFLMMYKNWIEPSLRRRFAGGGYALLNGQDEISSDPLAASQIFYDESLERIPEGYQITFFRTLLRKLAHQETVSKLVLFKWLNKFKVGEKEDYKWENLKPYERENIKRAIFDYSLIMSAKVMYLLLSGLFAGDDVEDNEFYYFILALLKRVSKERGSIVVTPWAPHEAMFILRNPVAGLDTYDDFYKFFDYMFAFESDDYYKTSNSKYGIQKGDMKLWNHLDRMVPGWRMLERKNQDYLRALETNKF